MIKSTSRVDGQGRIVVPANIRKEMCLDTGSVVTLTLDDEGTCRVEAMTERRCSVCGKSVEAASRFQLKGKYICNRCVKAIVQEAQEAVK